MLLQEEEMIPPALKALLDQYIAKFLLLERDQSLEVPLELESRWQPKLPGGDNGRGHRWPRFDSNTFSSITKCFPRLQIDDFEDGIVYTRSASFFNNFGSFRRLLRTAGWCKVDRRNCPKTQPSP